MRAYQIIGILLAPVLLGQAFFIRRRIHVLPEAAGPREGRSGSGPPLRLLIVGDSAGAGMGAETQDEALLGQTVARLCRHFTVDYKLIAKTGARTVEALAWLDGTDHKCDVAIISLSVNDVTKLTPQDRFLAQQASLWQRLREVHGAKQIIVSGVAPLGLFPALPQPLRWVMGCRSVDMGRALLAQAADHNDVTVVGFNAPLVPEEMSLDGFHPGTRIYAKWAKALVRRIDREMYMP